MIAIRSRIMEAEGSEPLAIRFVGMMVVGRFPVEAVSLFPVAICVGAGFKEILLESFWTKSGVGGDATSALGGSGISLAARDLDCVVFTMVFSSLTVQILSIFHFLFSLISAILSIL